MSKDNEQVFTVIAACPLAQNVYADGHARYYAADGSVVEDKCKAQTFLTTDDAQEFAKRHNLALGVVTYIARVTYRSDEVNRLWRNREKQ